MTNEYNNIDINSYFVIRYRIKVSVHDGTGESIFVIFDRDAITLLNKTCADIIELHEKVSYLFHIGLVYLFEFIYILLIFYWL